MKLFSRSQPAPPPPKPQKPFASRQVLAHRPRSGSRFLDAAKSDNLNAGWPSINYSGDAVIRHQVVRVRGRARYLASNDPYTRRFLMLCEENVVGPDGIRLQMRVINQIKDDGTTEFDARANQIIESAWQKWGKRRNCTLNRRQSFLEVQRLAITTVARDGEVFIRKIRGANNPFGFALQLIEADHLDVNLNKELPNSGYIRMGIQYDKNDAVVAYHVMERHPGDSILGQQTSHRTVSIPARNMIHLFIPERITQSRGIPWTVASMARSKMLDGYEQAELIAARVGASKMGFIVSPDGESYTGDGEGVDEHGNAVAITDADPGTFEQLPGGWDIKTFDPNHPTTAFHAFSKQILRGVTTGWGVGYNTVCNDYEGVNFSSLRQSNLSERDYWRKLQKWFIQSLHEEIFDDWLTMAITSGEINLPITKLEKFKAASWRPRGWQWVDPLKERTAQKMAIGLGLDSATNIAAEEGRDIEEVYQDLKREITLREKYGIFLADDTAVTIAVNADEGNGNAKKD